MIANRYSLVPMLGRLISGLVVGAMLAGSAAAEVFACPDVPVTVEAGRAETAERVCRAAALAETRLAACGLPLTETVEIRIAKPVFFDEAHCIAEADISCSLIRLPAPEEIPDLITEESVLSAIDPDLVFDSVVLHELVHIALSHQPGSENLSYTEHEYVAYALQLESLGPEGRAEILARHEIARPVIGERINIMILSFAPMRFAAYAWSYFSEPGNGCASVHAILSGTTLFPDLDGP